MAVRILSTWCSFTFPISTCVTGAAARTLRDCASGDIFVPAAPLRPTGA